MAATLRRRKPETCFQEMTRAVIGIWQPRDRKDLSVELREEIDMFLKKWDAKRAFDK